MAVERYTTKSGTAWRVRWMDAAGNRHSKSFTGKGAKKAAELYDAEVKSKKSKGEVVTTTKDTLGQVAERWWENKVTAGLSRNTQRMYGRAWNEHISPYLGPIPIVQIAATPDLINQWMLALKKGGVGQQSIIKAHTALSSILEYAKRNGWIGRNSAREADRPKASARIVYPMSPHAVELLRQAMLRKPYRPELQRRRDAAAVSIMAYSGLRPAEVWALTWGRIGKQSLLVAEAVNHGALEPTKTKKHRTTLLFAPIREELDELRKLAGNPGDDALVFPNMHGDPLSDYDWRNWRKRQFQRAAELVAESFPEDYASVVDATPYWCRHSFVSLLWRNPERYKPADIANYAGHSIETQQRVYLHVISEMMGKPGKPPEESIAEARKWATQVEFASPTDEQEAA